MVKGLQCPEGQDCPRQAYFGSFRLYQDSQRDCLSQEDIISDRWNFLCQKDTVLNIPEQIIDFTGVSHLKGRTVAIIFDAFKAVFMFYIQRGFRIQTVHADGEFRALKYLIQSIPAGTRVNLTSANKHVSEIERCIRVVKEISRAFHHSIPFSWIPKLITIHAILNIANILNCFPKKKGISLELSPCSILTGESLYYKKHLTIQPER